MLQTHSSVTWPTNVDVPTEWSHLSPKPWWNRLAATEEKEGGFFARLFGR